MTNSIGSISGGGSNGVFWNNNSSNKNVEDNKAQEQGANAAPERKDVNPDDVMRFLANQNYINPVTVETPKTTGAEGVDAETQERVAGYMERFEELYAIIEDEFGPELAPQAFDVAMDKLLGMA